MEPLSRYRERITEALRGAVPAEGALATLLRYPLGLSEPDGSPGPGLGGKLLRPSLCLFACEALGGKLEAAVPLGAALELVHVFSLVHDDIQDGDEVRRGRPAAWVVFGIGQAINAGDALLALALRTACAVPLPPEAIVAALTTLAGATLRMIEGQAMDLTLAGQQAGVRDYVEMARRKTGALLGCALELGAIAAGREDLRGLHRELGENLGLAFQIQDDLLALWGEPDKVGKPVGNDLARGKRSYPIAWALQQDPSLAELLSRGAMGEVRQGLTALGAREAGEKAAEEFLSRARALAKELPWSPWAKEAFAEILAALAARET